MEQRLLLVDDEAAIRDLYSLYFGTQGFTVVTASNAIEALDRVSRDAFDVILLDLGLGDSNGMNLIDPIRMVQPYTPVVIFSGRTLDQKVRADATQRGAVGILSKTYPLNYVIAEIRRFMAMAKHDRVSGAA